MFRFWKKLYFCSDRCTLPIFTSCYPLIAPCFHLKVPFLFPNSPIPFTYRSIYHTYINIYTHMCKCIYIFLHIYDFMNTYDLFFYWDTKCFSTCNSHNIVAFEFPKWKSLELRVTALESFLTKSFTMCSWTHNTLSGMLQIPVRIKALGAQPHAGSLSYLYWI